MSDQPKMTNEARHEWFTVNYYKHYPPAAVDDIHSAYSDAAHMCDAIAQDILCEHTVRGRVTERGKALAEAVKRAGNSIWALREKVP